jgi:hypothetical protein
MPENILIQPAFTKGEISPSLYGRVDLEEYQKGTQTMLNFICRAQGGASNRPGTEFVGSVQSGADISRLIPFTFSVVQSYGLLFGGGKLNVLKDGGFITTGVLPLTIPYADDELFDIKYAQSADVLYLVHPDYAPRKLSRTDHDQWEIEVIVFTGGPWGDNFPGITVKPSARLGTGVTIIADEDAFYSEMVGTYFRIGYPNPLDITQVEWTKGTIASYVSATQITVNLDDHVGYDYVVNHNFDFGLYRWIDASTGSGSVDTTSEDGAEFTTTGAADNAILKQTLTIAADMQYACGMLIHTITGVSANLAVSVAPAAGGSANFNTAGYKEFTGIVPTAGATEVVLQLNFTTGAGGGTCDVEFIYFTPDVLHSTSFWRVAAWNTNEDVGYPTTVLFFEQRLVFGGPPGEPQTNWHSKAGDFENFDWNTPIQEDDSFKYTIASQFVNAIQWQAALREMVIGTSGLEWLVSSGGEGALTPTTINAKPQSNYGSANILMIIIDDGIVFIPRGNKSVRNLKYSFEVAGYQSGDLSGVSEHLFEKKRVVDWGFARLPDSIIWCVLDDGTLLGMTYNPEFGVNGWHRHTTDGFYRSVCVVNNDNTDDVYFVIEREIGGSVVRYVERLMPRISNKSMYDYFFVDSGLKSGYDIVDAWIETSSGNEDVRVVIRNFDGLGTNDKIKINGVLGMTELNGNTYWVYEIATLGNGEDEFVLLNSSGGYPADRVDGTDYKDYIDGGYAWKYATTFSGLSHLEGETVNILADGSVVPPQVVSSGSVTLPTEAAAVVVGLPYTSDLKTLSPNLETSEGTAQGQEKTISEVTLRLEDTRGVWVGSDEDHLDELQLRTPEDEGDPIALFTGDKEISIEDGYDEGVVLIRNSDPIPVTVLAVIPKVITDDTR